VIALLWVLPVACGGSEESSPAATPPEVTQLAQHEATPQGAPGGPPLGIGEPLAPEPFTLEQRFLEAARQGDRRTLERALERGVDVNARDELGCSALLLAVRDAGDLAVVEFLESRGADSDAPDTNGRTPLSWAASNGRDDLVRHLLGRGAQLDVRDDAKRTPLFHAVLGNHRDTVRLLLERGAGVDPADEFGDTPLMLACAKGFDDMAKLLLERGADPAARNQEGRTARDRARGAPACQGDAQS
jgi:ankyrin repeat protein